MDNIEALLSPPSREIVGELSLEWNLGDLPLKNYRVEGCCVEPGEETTAFAVGQTDSEGEFVVPAEYKCKSKFVVNILARSLGDLCLQLKKREFYWPICKIQVFNTPAVGANTNGFGNPLADCCDDTNGPVVDPPPPPPNENEEEFQTLTDIPKSEWAFIPECMDFNVAHLFEKLNFSITVERVFAFEGGSE
jgi:hypothetical protein